jgi:hypothetical protein
MSSRRRFLTQAMILGAASPSAVGQESKSRPQVGPGQHVDPAWSLVDRVLAGFQGGPLAAANFNPPEAFLAMAQELANASQTQVGLQRGIGRLARYGMPLNRQIVEQWQQI